MNIFHLDDKELLMIVRSYDESFDTFEIELHNSMPCEGQRSLIPAVLMPVLTKEYGEPSEFIGRKFIFMQP